MYKQKIILVFIMMLFSLSLPGFAFSFNMMTAEELKDRLNAKQPVILLDIQKKNAYHEHHFYGSIRTYAYPARSDVELESAVQGVRMYERTSNEVIVIGPRGGKASQRTVGFLITRGIPEEKIFILQGGIREWPYKEMLLQIKTFSH